MEREQGRKDATADMSSDLSEGEEKGEEKSTPIVETMPPVETAMPHVESALALSPEAPPTPDKEPKPAKRLYMVLIRSVALPPM